MIELTGPRTVPRVPSGAERARHRRHAPPRHPDREPLRVVHLAQPTDGGVGRYVLAACLDQRARGWAVTLACPPGPLAEHALDHGVVWRSWSATRSPGPATAAETLAVRRLLAELVPDVVHLHSSKAGLAGRLVLRGRRPTLFQPHGWSWLAARGTTRRLSLGWERRAAGWTHAVVCVGSDELRAGVRAGLDARFRLVRNGVDLSAFPPTGPAHRRRARYLLGLAPDGPLAVCVGRITRQKGQDVLLAGWSAVRARCPDAHLVLVGAGELAADLLGDAHDGVRFVPPTPHVQTWLAAADVVVLPSRWEGLPLVALEAAATGRPLVGTDIDGLGEFVSPGMGALVPPDDHAALAKALADRLGDPALRAAEGRRAAATARRFDQRHTLTALSALTAQVAAAGHRIPAGAP